MTFIFVSFVAGILTVLAPCVLPLLPVIVGGSVSDTRSKLKPYIITASLSVSVIIFTLILKFATVFIDIPQYVWEGVSGFILVVFGLSMLFPILWEKFTSRISLKLSRKSNEVLASGVKKESFVGDVIIGASLGPVFSSCSPTYFVILAVVLPQSIVMGIIDLIAYSVGLSISLLAISLVGQRLVGKLQNVSDPSGWFKRSLGGLFVFIGILIATGVSASIQSYVIRNSSFDITKVDTALLKKVDLSNSPDRVVLPQGADPEPDTYPDEKPLGNDTQPSKESGSSIISSTAKSFVYPKYKEIANPAGFVNSEPFKLADLIGKKVILLDMMTYSCINCQRTFPYLSAWYSKYKDMGLEIVAIHTPEFAFEKKKSNVEEAFKKFGLKFPAVLDNDYGTWNAYANQYWPHKYLIDIDGYIRYDHIGEGGYEETEMQIKSLLKERASRLGESVKDNGLASSDIDEVVSSARSTETYFGAFRNSRFFGNGDGSRVYEDSFVLPKTFIPNQYYLGGKWKIEDQYIESEEDCIVAFSYESKDVYLVAESSANALAQVQNGDVSNQSSININLATLYTIVSNPKSISSVFYLRVPRGVRLYALTFG